MAELDGFFIIVARPVRGVEFSHRVDVCSVAHESFDMQQDLDGITGLANAHDIALGSSHVTCLGGFDLILGDVGNFVNLVNYHAGGLIVDVDDDDACPLIVSTFR